MTGNPKSSPWYTTPRPKRKRRGLEITLSDEAREMLERLAARWCDGNKSACVEALIMNRLGARRQD